MISTRGHRFPGDVISHAVLLYLRHKLFLKDVSELLIMRGRECLKTACRGLGP